MIARILPSESFTKVIEYHYKKIQEKTASNITPLLQNISKKEALKILEESTKVRAKTKCKKPLKKEPIFHVSLSLNHNETLNNEDFLELSQEYMQSMGFDNNNMLYFRHDDTDHTHVHVVCNRIDREKLTLIERSFEKINSMKISRKLEKKYGLIETKYTKGQDLATNMEQHRREGLLAKLKEKAFLCLKNSYSFESYKELLLNTGITMHIHKTGGKTRAGYRFMYYGKIHYFHSYNVGRDIKPEIIAERFNSQNDKEKIKTTLKGVLNRYKSIDSLGELKYLLLSEGITTKLSKYEDGNIFGIRFIYNGTEVKGSETGLSWSTLKTYLLDMDDRVELQHNTGDRENLYNILSGQWKKTEYLPPITNTEFKSLKGELQINFLKYYSFKKRHYTLQSYLDGLKILGVEPLSINNIIQDINVGNIKLSTVGLGIDQLNTMFIKNIENELYNCCKTNNLELIKNSLENLFGTQVNIKSNHVIIYGKSYDLTKYGMEQSKGKAASGKKDNIFRKDASRWHFDDMDEKNKKKKKKKKKDNNSDHQDINTEL